MTLDEIEERVKHSLEALNSPDELYDWRLTFFNQPAWSNLEEGCYFLSKGELTDTALKELIKIFRDRSEISYTDFHIKVAEPDKDDFRRMAVLFGPLNEHVRLLPPRDAEARKVYVHEKILSAMRLSMENKHVISEKIKQQFNWLMIREKEKSPDMLAVALNFESYNPYHKKLAPGPSVALTQHRGFEGTVEVAAPSPAPMFAPSVVDNSSFESRLAPAPVKSKRIGVRKQAKINGVPTEIEIFPYEPELDAPHELPDEVHEEFATYCQNLYERRNA